MASNKTAKRQVLIATILILMMTLCGSYRVLFISSSKVLYERRDSDVLNVCSYFSRGTQAQGSCRSSYCSFTGCRAGASSAQLPATLMAF